MSYVFNPFIGNLDNTGPVIDAAQFALSAHAASHAAGTKAQVISHPGDHAGLNSIIFFRADTAGTSGNSITLTFDGVDNIDTVVGAWNSANPSNTVTAIGDASQVLNNGEIIQLGGGTNAGNDAFKGINQNLNTADDVTFNTFNTQTFAEGLFIQIGNFYAPANQIEGNNTFFRIGTEDNGDKAAQIGYRAGGDTFGRNGFICLDFYGMDYLFQLSHDGGKPELWTGGTPQKLLTFGDGSGTGEIVSELPIGFGGALSATNAATTRTNLGLGTASQMPSGSFAPSNLYQNLSGSWQSTFVTVCALSASWGTGGGGGTDLASVTNYLSTNNVLVSGLSVAGNISAIGSVISRIPLVFTELSAYTLTLTDQSDLITINNSLTSFVYIPNDSSVNFGDGSQINISRLGSGTVTISAFPGVTLRSADNRNQLRAQNSTATIVKLSANDWLLFGDIS